MENMDFGCGNGQNLFVGLNIHYTYLSYKRKIQKDSAYS